MYRCLVIMPFLPEFDIVFASVKSALEAKSTETTPDSLIKGGIEVLWLKDLRHAGRITDDIVSELDEATICIADLTGTNPNVMWETGFAMANGKPVILIGQNVDELPFDLKIYRFTEYALDQLDVFQESIREGVRQTLNRYGLQPSLQTSAPPVVGRTYAVTGSTRPSRRGTETRVQRLLEPHLSPEITWLCGSNGTVDSVALRFLLDHGQRIYVVGYNAFDLSDEVRELVESRQTPFIDASIERFPKGMNGPTNRDILFCMKADTVVLLWNGTSQRTYALIDYYLDQQKDVQIGFI